jgi:Fe-S-cluster containining protein
LDVNELADTQERLFKQAMGLFECTQCGTCCQGEGGIHLTPEEIDRISAFLNFSPLDFLRRFCVEKNGRIYIHIREDGFCHFSKEGKCGIHAVKPGPCRKWPFLKPMLSDQPNWETVRNACPALAPYKTLEDYLKGEKGF